MLFTSVTVTPAAQKAYLDKQGAKKGGSSDASTSNKVSAPLSPRPVKSLKRTANQALNEAGPSNSKPTKKTKA